MNGLIGKKVGMSRLFDSDGENIPVSVIQAGPCVVVQIKTKNNDGYRAIQVGYSNKEQKKTNNPMMGHFKKAKVEPKNYLMEFPLRKDQKIKIGQVIDVDIFKEGDVVNISGYSKGKGFAGVVKRYGFHGGPKSHGKSDQLRAGGSIGQSSDPSRVWPGMKMPGHMGNKKVLIKNLKVVSVDKDTHHLYIKGPIPGPRNGIVVVTKS